LVPEVLVRVQTGQRDESKRVEGARPVTVTTVVLAAGVGKRMKSDLPKVLHAAAGLPLVAHVVRAAAPLEPDRLVLVISSGHRDAVAAAVAQAGYSGDVVYAFQDPPKGTGDAVRIALDQGEVADGLVLVLPGDSPLIESEVLGQLLSNHPADAAATVMTARVQAPFGYGRVLRAADGSVEGIIEERDATAEQKSIDEVNTSIYVFSAGALRGVIERIGADNDQAEYYLTDAIALLRADGQRVVAMETSGEQTAGVNSRTQLALVSKVLRQRAAEALMDQGVTIIDPETTYVDATVVGHRDAVIHPFTFLEGSTVIGERAQIGPHARIVDSRIDDDASVTHAVVRESHVGPEASVGPYASLRPGTSLERGAHLGTFVEAKNSTIGEGSKANHLAYLGDAEIGRGVNIGAGTITCNWDGTAKHKTIIEDEAYIGSDTMLVAPTRIGKRAATGAGAVVRGEVPDEALAVGVPARIIEGKGDKMAKGQDDKA
jgi:bifunctional UDP-N-acetylglucosamine pyrophosphorylase / glucosamine-1-phosphate N-acetyltransferase